MSSDVVVKFSDLYKESVVPSLKKKYNISNAHLVPKIKQVVISMRFNDKDTKNDVSAALSELALISGRKPAYSKAKKSISSFKLREGQMVGAYVTLRGKVMYEFLERLVYLVLPRVHDFKGFKASSLDDQFNFSFGIKDHLVFNELSYDKIAKQRGLNVAINISASSKEESVDLLRGFFIPIKL